MKREDEVPSSTAGPGGRDRCLGHRTETTADRGGEDGQIPDPKPTLAALRNGRLRAAGAVPVSGALHAQGEERPCPFPFLRWENRGGSVGTLAGPRSQDKWGAVWGWEQTM